MSCRVWSKFQATRKNNGPVVKLRIQDLTENRMEEILDLMVSFYIRDEAFHKAAGIIKNPEVVAEMRVLLAARLKDPYVHSIICCEDKEDGEFETIVGVSLVFLAGYKPISWEKFKTAEMRQLYKMIIGVISYLHNYFENLKLPCYYVNGDIVVHPEFRHLGIATEFLKARSLTTVAHNVPAVGALMTSIGTQKAAEKANWKTIQEVSIKDIEKEHGVTFEETGVMKIVVWEQSQC